MEKRSRALTPHCKYCGEHNGKKNYCPKKRKGHYQLEIIEASQRG